MEEGESGYELELIYEKAEADTASIKAGKRIEEKSSRGKDTEAYKEVDFRYAGRKKFAER